VGASTIDAKRIETTHAPVLDFRGLDTPGGSVMRGGRGSGSQGSSEAPDRSALLSVRRGLAAGALAPGADRETSGSVLSSVEAATAFSAASSTSDACRINVTSGGFGVSAPGSDCGNIDGR
jgi:hypothetical protein